MAAQPITLALSKGRILEESLPLLGRAGIHARESVAASRKLIFQTNLPHLRLVVVRATDVPTYVENGGADLGFVGLDVLTEHGSGNLYEPLDLEIARCRLMTAGPVGAEARPGRLRVATKFVNITRQFYARRRQQVDLIKLYGSMELAPLVGLADRIVDLVDTGRTLQANGLEPLELIMDVSTRLVVNKASMKSRRGDVLQLTDALERAVGEARETADA